MARTVILLGHWVPWQVYAIALLGWGFGAAALRRTFFVHAQSSTRPNRLYHLRRLHCPGTPDARPAVSSIQQPSISSPRRRLCSLCLRTSRPNHRVVRNKTPKIHVCLCHPWNLSR